MEDDRVRALDGDEVVVGEGVLAVPVVERAVVPVLQKETRRGFVKTMANNRFPFIKKTAKYYSPLYRI